MNSLVLLLSLILCVIALYLLYLLTRTAKHLSDKNYNHDRSDVIFLVMVLFLIVLIAPYLFTLPIFNCYKSDKGGTGEIGDTIGGITAPFINGIGAILVYIAFKEQVKSSYQARNLEISKIINDRLNWLKTDPYNIVNVENNIKISLAARSIAEHPFNQATYLLSEFEDLFDMALKNTGEKELLTKQIQYLYRIVYRDRMIEIQKHANVFHPFNLNHPQIMIVFDFMALFNSADGKLKP